MIKQIFIICNNKTLVIECNLKDSIKDVLDKVRKKIKTKCSSLYLTYNSKTLESDKTLEYYNINNNNTLFINVRIG